MVCNSQARPWKMLARPLKMLGLAGLCMLKHQLACPYFNKAWALPMDTTLNMSVTALIKLTHTKCCCTACARHTTKERCRSQQDHASSHSCMCGIAVTFYIAHATKSYSTSAYLAQVHE
jgi:hypothetical protein